MRRSGRSSGARTGSVCLRASARRGHSAHALDPARSVLDGLAGGGDAGLAKEDHERPWFAAEHPRHRVRIARGFWLFETPCTQALWQAVMGENPSRFQDPERPVEQVSWEDVQGFIAGINDRMPGLDLCLPSEAQWEYCLPSGYRDGAVYRADRDPGRA